MFVYISVSTRAFLQKFTTTRKQAKSADYGRNIRSPLFINVEIFQEDQCFL